MWGGGERGSMDQKLGQSPVPQLLCPVALQVLFYATSLSFHSIELVIELHKFHFFILEVKRRRYNLFSLLSMIDYFISLSG